MTITNSPPVDRPGKQDVHGVSPLTARLDPWMSDLISPRNYDSLSRALETYGSPLHILETEPFENNVLELLESGWDHEIDFQVYFARKANKCLTFVDAMRRLDGGVDIASAEELTQVLDAGIFPDRIICTAAVKDQQLINLCVHHQVMIAVDNSDELSSIKATGRDVPIALRVGGFRHEGRKLETRFGIDVDDVADFARQLGDLSIHGLQFHLDGYDSGQRISAVRQCLGLIDQLRHDGHPIQFLDIGGGFPISYLDDPVQWKRFWKNQRRAIKGEISPLTYRNHPLGLQLHEGEVHGKPNCYPFYQSPTRKQWFETILEEIGSEIRSRNLQLRCEPGRALLDGCGVTVARVEFVKPRAGFTNEHYVGLSMNRTQCRTSSDDFLVDPILVQSGNRDQPGCEGYLVGTYCTESELLCLRKLVFPNGIARGDLVVFPNTGGYFMHFLESRSHQFPLAKNLVMDKKQLDPIDFLY